MVGYVKGEVFVDAVSALYCPIRRGMFLDIVNLALIKWLFIIEGVVGV